MCWADQRGINAPFRAAGLRAGRQGYADTIKVVLPMADRPARVPIRWGLIPSWWKKTAKDVPSTFNARVETVAEKPTFRSAFKRKRCRMEADARRQAALFHQRRRPWRAQHRRALGSVAQRRHRRNPIVLHHDRLDANAFTRAVNKPNAGASRTPGPRSMAEQRSRTGTTPTGGRRSPSQMAGVAAGERIGGGDNPALIAEVAANRRPLN
jgi:hypothetical protein